jgi:hypothetical protein
MIRITPSRLTTLQYSQIGLTLLRTFTGRLQFGSHETSKTLNKAEPGVARNARM